MMHPPRPRLTVRVGITGHRPNKLGGPAAERIARQLNDVFAVIDAAARDILAVSRDVYASASHAVRLVSGFAEGADQMAVQASPPGWEIEAILPFRTSEYLNDFTASAAGDGRNVRAEFEASLARADTVTELVSAPAGGEPRDKAYADAGSYQLRQIDVLVAVWDGRPPKTGGTGAIAKNAFEGGIPVVWLSTAEEHPPRLIRGFDKRGDPIAPEADCTSGPLQATLQDMLAPPSQTVRGARRSARSALAQFYREHWRASCYFPVFDLLKRVANRQPLRFVIRSDPFETLLRGWDKFITDAPDADNLRRRLREVLVPRYVWADALAIYFSHLYRSAYVLAYALSAVAVFIALGSLSFDRLGAKAVWVLAELVVIGAIILMIVLGRRWRWHERWLDYRALAERLRHGRFLACISEFGRLDEGARQREGGESSWIVWYLRASLREVGLPSAAIDATYQWRILNATLVHELRDQIEYHETNIASAQRIDHLLHRLGVICFSVTFAVLAVFLAGYLLQLALAQWPATAAVAGFLSATLSQLKGVMIFFSAGLPALGAALAGIRVHGDFEGSKERSEHMVGALGSLEADYVAARDREPVREDTAEMLIATARILSEDVAAWQQLYGRKRLTLPA